MSGMYDPETEAEGFQAFRAFRLHTDCVTCRTGRCEEWGRLSEAVRKAVRLALTPYRITWEGGERGAWDESTARAMAHRHRGTITRTPVAGQTGGSARMIVHTEILGSVGRVWLTEESDGKWLNIGAETEGGLKKVIRLRESDARWLRASLKDMDRQFDSE